MQTFLEPPASRTSDTSLQAQVRCVEREIALRRGVYGRMVRDGRMKRQVADDELAAMGAVLVTVRAARQVELAQEAQDRHALEAKVQAIVQQGKAEDEERRDMAASNERLASGGHPKPGGHAPGS